MDQLGKQTLKQIVYTIKNNIESGLKTTHNYNFSIDQLKNTVISERNAIIKQLEMNNTLDLEDLEQEVNCIPLDCEDFALCCNETDTQNPALHFTVPYFDKVMYVGTVDENLSFKIYESSMSRYNKFKDKRLLKRPYVRFRNANGVKHGFVFNPPTKNLKYISMRAIFENPFDINQFDCCQYDADTDRFPAPDYIVQQIIDSVTSKYASYYYRFQGAAKPDTETSIG